MLEAIEAGDHQRLTDLLVFQDMTCRVVIRDAGDLPACPESVADGSLVSVFPESFCEGSYVHDGDQPEAFDALDHMRLYAIYSGSDVGPRRSDYGVVLSGGGGIWLISEGRIDGIAHGCGADVRTLVASNGLSRVVIAPADSADCGPADAAQRTFGDMDGDGTLDHVYLTTVDSDIRIGACWAGASGDVAVGGMATTILRVFNALGDDEAEIFYGDSTATSFIIQIAQVVDDDLVGVAEGRHPLSFEVSRQPDGNGTIIGHGMECADIDGDGVSELVELSYVRTGDAVVWTRVPFELTGGVATRGTPITGELTVGIDDETIEGMHAAICHGAVLFSAAQTPP